MTVRAIATKFPGTQHLQPALMRQVQTGTPIDRQDRSLIESISLISKTSPDFWSAPKGGHRAYAPAYFQYPAMMAPVVQRELLSLLLEATPGATSILDPFAGSGTVLTEAMYAGLNIRAQDINPLAVLICKVKSGPFHVDILEARLRETLKRITLDTSRAIETPLLNHKKWFRPRASLELSRIRRAICRIKDLWVRRFFWICLAETVRRSSNSRTSTYKLHIRHPQTLNLVPWPLDIFANIARKNIEKHEHTALRLAELGQLNNGTYRYNISVNLRDTRLPIPGVHDLSMTSPPYGDNTSTVPYGQNAYLPLNWIDLEDIDPQSTAAFLSSTHEIDRLSLGGEKAKSTQPDMLAPLMNLSPTLKKTLNRLADKPRERCVRVIAFIRDLNQTLAPISNSLKEGGYMTWTVGNRRVGGVEIPLSEVLSELLAHQNVKRVMEFRRKIPSKRMAIRNSTSQTMRSEKIVIFRKQFSPPSEAA